jgi:hypothetical protein
MGLSARAGVIEGVKEIFESEDIEDSLWWIRAGSLGFIRSASAIDQFQDLQLTISNARPPPQE